MADIYNSNNVPHSVPGGVVEFFTAAGVSKGTRVVEGFTPQRPVVAVQRPNQVGGPGGFALASVAQATGSTSVQTATSASIFIFVGDYFIIDFTANSGAVEKWVVTETSDPFQFSEYWKQEVSLLKDHFYAP